jgi:hypothetical protein
MLRYKLRTGVFLTASVSPDEKSLTLLLVPFIFADVLKKGIPHTQEQAALAEDARSGESPPLRGPLNY